MLNKVVLMGRCGNDPEMRMTGSGTPVTSVTIAVDRDFKDANGNKETDWIDLVAFRETAKFIKNHFAKGRMIVVSGRLQVRSWNDKEGNKRKTAEVVVDSAYFADSKSNAPAQNFAPIEEADEGLPF